MGLIDEKASWFNLHKFFDLADATDLDEGMVAYERYHMVMRRLAEKYEYPTEFVCAVFCSLSPNSDYWGNLRSTVSVLQGINECRPDDDIVVSTYGHCKSRALAYARGAKSFTAETKGPKILNFYHNILTPHSSRWVTIDGHMVGVMRDSRGTMRELLIRPAEYREYADLIKQFAFRNFMLPQQMQATLWFVRKRLLNVKYDAAQADLFGSADDMWKTARDVDTIKPYTKREVKIIQAMHGETAEERADARNQLFGVLPTMRKPDATKQG
jgi:hypothetical protein